MIHPISSGDIVARRYRAVRRIACGAMGEVWEGVHLKLGQRVALKVLRPEGHGNPEISKRFTREAFLLARIESEHVVRIVDFIERTRHGSVLVMEFIEGESFADLLRRKSVSIEEAVDIAIDVLHGLSALHARHIIHRDVKPGNIVLRTSDNGRRHAILVDLGVGRLVDQPAEDGAVTMPVGDEMTRADRVVGTVEYMPPEQITSCQTVAMEVDIYAVGAVLYRAASGKHPFGDLHGIDLLRAKTEKPAPPMHLDRKDTIAREFEAIVMRSMTTKPGERFQSAQQFAAALAHLRLQIEIRRVVELADDDVKLAAPPPLPSARNRMRRAVALLLGAALAIGFAACSSDASSAADTNERAQ